MRVPDEIRKCVAFVGCNTGNGPKLVGTCALLAVDAGLDDLHFTYAVTAAHVVELCQENAIGGRLWFRMNQRSGGFVWLHTEVADWRFHPEDRRVDVAAIDVQLPSSVVDYLTFPLGRGAATEEVIKREGIGVGEDVFLTGLFISHYGTERNIPIVRAGNIAAMPSEPIDTKRGATDAYLIECRSIGGLSGSPVFVHLGMVRHLDGQPRFSTRVTGTYYLLGLMMGHFDVHPTPHVVDGDGIRDETVNMGIGVVASVYRIQEVLDHPDSVRERQLAVDKLRAAKLPTEDQVSPLPASSSTDE